MKKLIIFSIILVSFLLISCSKSNVPNIDAPKKTITIGGIEDNEPYTYSDSMGVRMGFNIDVINELFNKRDYEITYKPVSYDNFYEKLKNKEVDLVIGVQYDAEYVNRLKYSKPLLKNYFNIFVKTSERSIRSIQDLTGKKIAVYKYDPAYQYFKTSDKVRVFLCDSQRDAYLLVRSDVADAYVANKYTALSYIEDSIKKGNLMIVGETYTVLPSAIAALEENKKLIDKVNVRIDELKSSGVLDKLQSKWFGEELTNKTMLWIRIAIGFVIVGVVLLLIILSIMRINSILKKEVNIRTDKIKEEIKYKEAIVESLFDYLITLDQDLNITAINSRVKDIDIIENRIMINTSIESTGLTKLIMMEDIKNVYTSRQKILDRERKIEDNDSERYVEYNIAPIIVDDEMKGATITLKDITEEKQMKKRIAQQDKMESLGRLIASIAHEIRNPLASIDMYIKLIPEKIDNAEFRKQITEDIPKEISRLNNLVKYLLDYSAPKPSEISNFCIDAEISFVLMLLRNKFDNNQIDIYTEIDKDILVYFDKHQFRQIIINIIINAVEALENVEKPNIEIICKRKDNCCIISISNNGASIDSHIADKVFEPFFSTKSKGYGLGLSIVSQLCKENNAEIILDRSFKRGTRFIIKIATLNEARSDSNEKLVNC